jgi:hypothetical protein
MSVRGSVRPVPYCSGEKSRVIALAPVVVAGAFDDFRQAEVTSTRAVGVSLIFPRLHLGAGWPGRGCAGRPGRRRYRRTRAAPLRSRGQALEALAVVPGDEVHHRYCLASTTN